MQLKPIASDRGIYNAAIPNRMAASDLEPVSVESRFCWFLNTPNYRPI